MGDRSSGRFARLVSVTCMISIFSCPAGTKLSTHARRPSARFSRVTRCHSRPAVRTASSQSGSKRCPCWGALWPVADQGRPPLTCTQKFRLSRPERRLSSLAGARRKQFCPLLQSPASRGVTLEIIASLTRGK